MAQNAPEGTGLHALHETTIVNDSYADIDSLTNPMNVHLLTWCESFHQQLNQALGFLGQGLFGRYLHTRHMYSSDTCSMVSFHNS